MNGSIAAVILAAGEGRRFGGPKALAGSEGRSWLSGSIEKILAAGVRWVSIVIGAGAETVRGDPSIRAILPPARDPECTISWVHNADWGHGRTGSIQRGLDDLPSGTRGALIHQVDFPFVRETTLRLLIGRFEEDPRAEQRIFVPEFGGKRGHPILVGRGLWSEIKALGPDEPLHLVIRRDLLRVVEVTVEDEGVLRNMNKPPLTQREDAR